MQAHEQQLRMLGCDPLCFSRTNHVEHSQRLIADSCPFNFSMLTDIHGFTEEQNIAH